MKRCYDIGVSKVKLERCGITNLLVCHWSPIYATFFNGNWRDGTQAWFSAVHSHFSQKCPWEIFALRCLLACSITGVIRIHLKPCLNGICQHSESFSKGSRLCGFPGSTINRSEMKRQTMGAGALAADQCLVLNRAWRQMLASSGPEHCCPAAPSISQEISALCSRQGMFWKGKKVLSSCSFTWFCLILFFSLRFYGGT